MIVVLLLLLIRHLRACIDYFVVTSRWLYSETASIYCTTGSAVPNSTIIRLQYSGIVVGGSQVVVHVNRTEVGTQSAIIV